MSRRLAAAVALAALGACLLVAQVGSARSDVTSGGTLNIDLSTDIDYTDPALAYLSSSWELEFATGLKLLNYPDANGPRASQLQPEAATAFPKVSNGGRTYDFTVDAPWTKFSNGEAVTAASFAAALNRIADPKMQSPATTFLSDIAGAQAVIDGKATSISGVKVRGKHLVVTLTKPSPDFLARIAMPFFTAIPVNLAHDPNGVLTPPSAGPYYIVSRTPNRDIVLKRNPYYKGKRPHNLAGIAYHIGDSLEAIQLNVQSGRSDYAAQGVPPTAYAELARKYGINKGRFWVKPQIAVQYVAMNTEQPLFKNNPSLRKAVNYALDRRALLTQSGFLAGQRTDQILPPGVPGYRNAALYPLKGPDLVTARKYAQGNTRSGKAVLYASNRGASPLQAQILQFNLKQIGIDVETKLWTRAVQIQKEGTRGEPFDLTLEGWIADYPDPFDFVNVLLDGSTLQDANNNNYSYFTEPKFLKEMHRAASLSGAARYKAYGDLDVQMMHESAPWAPRAIPTNRTFFSSRVGCVTFHAIYGVDLTALCTKSGT